MKFGVADKVFDNTQELANIALWQIGLAEAPGTTSKLASQEAYWCRGIMLLGRLTVPPPLAEHSGEHTSAIEGFEAEGLVTTDGSGLQGSSPSLRRCGFAVVLPRTGEPPAEWKHLKLPLLGHQTVPRSELSAVLAVAKAMVAPVDLWTDHKAIVDAFTTGLSKFMPAANQDLWAELAEQLQKKRLALRVKWVPSHADKFEDLDPNIDPLIYSGNRKADELAKDAAKEHKLSDKTIAEVHEEEDRCKEVLRRLIGISSAFLAATPRQPKVPKPPEYKPSLAERVSDARAGSDHHLCIGPGGKEAICTACLARAPMQQNRLLHWLASSCGTDTPGVPHPSHRMALRGLLAICLNCGCWSQSRHRALLAPCNESPRTALQQMSLRRYHAHRPMPGADVCHIRAARIRKPDLLIVAVLDSDSDEVG